MDKESLLKLFNDHYQANDQLWRAVTALSDAQFAQPQNDGGPSLHTQIVRMVVNENLWVNYLWHGEVEFLQNSQLPTRAAIREEWDALEEEIHDFITELSPTELENRVEPVFLDLGASFELRDILLSVIQTAATSRAQIYLHLSRLGFPALIQDPFSFPVEQVVHGVAAR
ncbi:MAG TPA: DinB family protein [Aggregatilinea sp.]|uniref:DinB family protein n=1 Tax=Aggregatilinea sp. TaxID=2806333 RepID=UPI002B91BD84|nr:DinB family protein [Aggregatilinea sp.]HML20305.1 DinB family protein [Aggregatilinea sp.]